MRGEHEAPLEDLRDDFRRARVEQPRKLAVVERAHDDRHLRPRMLDVMQYLERGGGVGEGDRYRARLGKPRRDKGFATGGIAVNHAAVVGRGFSDSLRIRIERDELNLLGFE